MKILILLGALLATSALAEEGKSKIKNEAEVEKVAGAIEEDENSTRQGDEAGVLKGNERDAASGTVTGRRQHGVAARDAASGMPSGKRQHRLDDDSDGDGVERKANDCDDDCDGTVDETARKAKRQDRKTTRD